MKLRGLVTRIQPLRAQCIIGLRVMPASYHGGLVELSSRLSRSAVGPERSEVEGDLLFLIRRNEFQ
jgi:hypothetical protein